MIRVAALLLFAAHAAAQCLPPHGVAMPEAGTEVLCGYRFGAIAAAGDRVLGAWMTSRPGFSDISGTIAGAPLDAAGALRQRTQRELVRVPAAPSIATDGTNFLLVWNDAGYTGATLLDPDGHELRSERVDRGERGSRLSTTGSAFAAWNGTEYVVLTDELFEGRWRVIAVAVAPDGTLGARNVIAPDARAVALLPGYAFWRSASTISGARLSGVAMTGARVVAGNASIAVARDETTVLLVTRDESGTVVAQRLDPSLVPAGPTIVLGTSNSSFIAAVHEGGGSFLAFWSDAGGRVRAARLDGQAPFDVADGNVLGAAATGSTTVVLASAGCGTVTTAAIPRGERRAASQGAVSLSTVSRYFAAAVPTATGHQLFWNDGGKVLAAHLRGRTISTPVQLHTAGAISLADAAPFRGGTAAVYDVPVSGTSTVKLARFSETGELLGEPTVITTARFTFNSRVATHDDTILVLTEEIRGELSVFDLFATFVDATGRITDRILLGEAEDGFGLDGRWDDSHWYASWTNADATFDHVSYDITTRTRRVTVLPEAPHPNQALVAGTEPMYVWLGDLAIRASFPHSNNADVPVVVAEHPVWPVTATENEVTWVEHADGAKIIRRARVTPAGASEPETLLCLTANDEVQALPVFRDGVLTGVALSERGTSHLTFHEVTGPRKRRAVR